MSYPDRLIAWMMEHPRVLQKWLWQLGQGENPEIPPELLYWAEQDPWNRKILDAVQAAVEDRTIPAFLGVLAEARGYHPRSVEGDAYEETLLYFRGK
jgi:hypothetical protein